MAKNLAASVRARLANHAKETQRPFQEVLTYYGVERFLFRLAQSTYRDRFLLKGALMLRVWETPDARPTKDIDLLGHVGNQVETLENIIREVCVAGNVEDGLHFDPATVAGERIKEDAEYEGVRVKFMGYLDRARIPMQLDVGFGDVVHPAPEELTYPIILDLPAPRLRMYPRETVVAEKFQAMVLLGTTNSRMKDFFDIWLLCQRFDFEGLPLAQAISETFRNRETELDPDPVALTSAFTATEHTQRQWGAFMNRSKLVGPTTLDEAREPLRSFLLPVARTLATGSEFTAHWAAPGPWG